MNESDDEDYTTIDASGDDISVNTYYAIINASGEDISAINGSYYTQYICFDMIMNNFMI